MFQSLLAFPGAGLVFGFTACQDMMAANLALSLATDETSAAVLQKEKSQSISMRLMRLQVGLTMYKTCKCFHSQASHGGSIRFYATEVLFFVCIKLEHSHVDLLSTSEEHSKVLSSATHTNLVHGDITCTEC